MLKIRRPLGRLIFNMGIAIPGKSFLLRRPPACTLQHLGMCTEISIICFQLQNFNNLIVNRVNLNDLVPPSCLIYDTTVALSHIKWTTLPCRWFRSPLIAHNTALSLRVLMWFWLCAGDHWPLTLRSPSWAPHPRREASVYSVTSVSGLLSDKPWQTARNAHQASWHMTQSRTQIHWSQSSEDWSQPVRAHHWIGRRDQRSHVLDGSWHSVYVQSWDGSRPAPMVEDSLIFNYIFSRGATVKSWALKCMPINWKSWVGSDFR